MVPGGVAQTDGRLIPGDRLVAVNDINVERASLDKAVQILKGAPKGIVRITVSKPFTSNDAMSQASQVRSVLHILFPSSHKAVAKYIDFSII